MALSEAATPGVTDSPATNVNPPSETWPTGGMPHILPAVPGLPSNLQPLVPVLNSPQSDGELSLQEKNVAAYIGGCIVHETKF